MTEYGFARSAGSTINSASNAEEIAFLRHGLEVITTWPALAHRAAVIAATEQRLARLVATFDAER
jgi:hypothetical protein